MLSKNAEVGKPGANTHTSNWEVLVEGRLSIVAECQWVGWHPGGPILDEFLGMSSP